MLREIRRVAKSLIGQEREITPVLDIALVITV